MKFQNSKSHSPECWNLKFQNSKFKISAPELEFEISKFKIQNLTLRSWNSKFKIQNSKFKNLTPELEFQNFKIQNLTLRSWNLKFQNSKSHSPELENFKIQNSKSHSPELEFEISKFKISLSGAGISKFQNPLSSGEWNLKSSSSGE